MAVKKEKEKTIAESLRDFNNTLGGIINAGKDIEKTVSSVNSKPAKTDTRILGNEVPKDYTNLYIIGAVLLGVVGLLIWKFKK